MNQNDRNLIVDFEQCPSTWQRIKLGDICDIIGGFAAPKGDEPFKNGTIPYIRMQDLGKYHRTYNLTETKDKLNLNFVQKNKSRIIKKGSILIPRSGSVALNHRAILGVDACIVSHICALSLKSSAIDNEFLYYVLCNFDMEKIVKKTTGLDAITFDDVKRIVIPIPPYEIQKKIVSILIKADNMKEKRKKSIQYVSKLIQSAFAEIFGDPSSLIMKENHTKLSKVANLRGGIAMNKDRRSGMNRIPYITIRNVYREEFDLSDLRTISVSESDLEKWHLEYGDLCVLEGGDKADVGRTAVYQNQPIPCVHQNHIFRVRLNKNMLNPFFVSAYLNSDYVRTIFSRLAKATTGIYTLNLTELGKIEIPIPMISKQKEFEMIYLKIRKIQNSIVDEEKLYDLYEELQFKSFKGQLT